MIEKKNEKKEAVHIACPDTDRKTDGQDAAVKDNDFEEICEGIDRSAACIGLIISDLFKTVTMAAAHLPNMELHSNLINVIVDDDSILVQIDSLSGETEQDDTASLYAGDPGYEEDGWYQESDDEEGRLFDGD